MSKFWKNWILNYYLINNRHFKFDWIIHFWLQHICTLKICISSWNRKLTFIFNFCILEVLSGAVFMITYYNGYNLTDKYMLSKFQKIIFILLSHVLGLNHHWRYFLKVWNCAITVPSLKVLKILSNFNFIFS